MVKILFWLSFFALHWLILLGVAERDFYVVGSEIFFFVGACLLSLAEASLRDALRKEKKE